MKQLIGKTIKNIKKLDYINQVDSKEIFDLSDGEIEVEFIDGIKIRIWVSEYGGIDLLKKENKNE